MNTTLSSSRAEALQLQFARRVAVRLDEIAGETTPDVSERLRFGREQALARARQLRAAAATSEFVASQGRTVTAMLGGGSRWWTRLASALPLILLIVGLVLIQERETREQIEAAAEIDAALLSDNLPPDAYGDPGFLEFLRSPQP